MHSKSKSNIFTSVHICTRLQYKILHLLVTVPVEVPLPLSLPSTKEPQKTIVDTFLYQEVPVLIPVPVPVLLLVNTKTNCGYFFVSVSTGYRTLINHIISSLLIYLYQKQIVDTFLVSVNTGTVH